MGGGGGGGRGGLNFSFKMSKIVGIAQAQALVIHQVGWEGGGGGKEGEQYLFLR